jgi:EmrB/QacA subfamily drug resistance transporter
VTPESATTLTVPGHLRAPTPVRHRAARSRPALVLAAILTAQLMVVLDATIVNVALPDIQRALHFSPADLSWVINAYSLVFGGLLLLGARMGDLLGRRRTFLAGIGVFTLASLAGGFAQSEAALLLARAVQGVGAAVAAPSALALLTTMFPEGRERIRALGYYTAVSIGGGAVGLIAGGMLTQWVSWRWVLFVNVPIGIALIVLARAVLAETAPRPGRFDLGGALTSTLGVAALVYGFVRAATVGWSDVLTVAAFTAGVMLLAAFVLVELRASAPITPLRLFADRNRSAANLARLLLMAGVFGMLFFLSQFLQEVLRYSPLKAGMAFLPITVALFTASQVSARVVERVGARTLMTGGIALSTFGLLWLTQLSQHTGYPGILGPLLLFGTGNGLAFVPLTAAGLSGVAPADAGAASGLLNVMQQVGGALGLAVLVTVASAAGPAGGRLPGGPQAGQALIAGVDHAFLVAALFLVGALLLVSLAIRGPARRPALQVEAQPEAAS